MSKNNSFILNLILMFADRLRHELLVRIIYCLAAKIRSIMLNLGLPTFVFFDDV